MYTFSIIMKILSKIKEITNIKMFGISLILLRIFMIIENVCPNYQMYDLCARFSFFVCSKSPRSRNLGSIGSIYLKKVYKLSDIRFFRQAQFLCLCQEPTLTKFGVDRMDKKRFISKKYISSQNLE